LPGQEVSIAGNPVEHAGAAAVRSQRNVFHRLKDCLQNCFLGYPEEFREPALGHSVYANNKAQVDNAEAASMTLYQFDFLEGSDVLNRRGMERIVRIASLLPRTFFPIVIEPSCGPPALDEARRQAVLNVLARGPFPVPAARIVVGRPAPVGLSGVEAVLVYRNLLYQTERQGVQVGLGGGLIGGTGGQAVGSSGPSGGTSSGFSTGTSNP
jgi:hypothetical protein